MGSLKPGATYVYERANGITYAREIGADPSTRIEIGWDYDSRTDDGRPLRLHIQDSMLWDEIRRAARTNDALRDELERVIVFYLLSKEHDQ